MVSEKYTYNTEFSTDCGSVAHKKFRLNKVWDDKIVVVTWWNIISGNDTSSQLSKSSKLFITMELRGFWLFIVKTSRANNRFVDIYIYLYQHLEWRREFVFFKLWKKKW